MQKPTPFVASSASARELFADLLANVQRPLYAFVHGLLRNEEQTHDILQDVYVDAWRAAQAGAPPFGPVLNEEGIRRWLFHAAYCDAISVLRRRRLIRWRSLDAPEFGASEQPQAAEPFEDQVLESQIVQAALATLTPDEAATLLLNAIQGYTATEIAEMLGISVEASKKRLSRAKQRLRDAYLAQSDAHFRPDLS